MKSKSYKRTKTYKLASKIIGSLNGDSSFIEQWFTSPHVALGFKTPLELCKTDKGKKEVENFLGRLQHGVFS